MDNYSVNTFLTGMDQDTSISKYKPTSYYSANNMRLTSMDGVSLGTIENEKGMAISFKFPNVSVIRLNISAIGTWNGTLAFSGLTISIGSAIDVYGLGKYIADYMASAPGGSVAWDSNESQPDPYYSSYSNASYRVVQHGLTVSVIGLGDVTITNSGGTATITKSYTNTNNQTIIGYTNIRDRLIVFTCNKDVVTETPTTEYGCIWQVQYNSSNTVINLDGSGHLTTPSHLLYAGILNFSKAFSIVATSFHVNEFIGSIYWSDNYNNLRHANIYDKFLLSASTTDLEVIPTVSFTKPKITELYTGGAYKSGAVMYCYQYYNKYSGESIISPVSNMVNLTADSETESNSSYYSGDPIDVNTGKVVRVVVDNLNINFDHLRLYAIYYASINDTPEILLVADRRIRNLSTLDIIDDGYSYLGKSTYMELRNYEKMIFSCKDLTIKDNRLIVGNIKESQFDVTYDCRAFRHANTSTAFWSDDEKTSFSDVGDFDDCVTGDYDTYKYQRSSSVVGGEGVNIKYKFNTKQLVLDGGGGYNSLGSPKTFQNWSSTLGSNFVDNHYYGNYASPINSGQLVGYKRGETYRFGCVFINSRGQRSPVKWIADIKIPDVNEMSSSFNFVTSSNQIVKSPLINMNTLRKLVLVDQSVSYMVVTIIAYGSTYTFQLYFENYINIFNSTSTRITWDAIFVELKKLIETQLNFCTVSRYAPQSLPTMYLILTSHQAGTVFTVASCKIDYYNSDDVLYSSDSPFVETQGPSTSTSAVSSCLPIYETVGSQTVANIVYPEFYFINSLPVDDYGISCSYEIVRVKRQDKDVSRVGQGLLLPTMEESYTASLFPVPGFGFPPKQVMNSTAYAANAKQLSATKYVNFISPDIIFRKKLISNSDSVNIIGMCSMKSVADGPLKFSSYVPVTNSGAIITKGITESINATSGTDIKGIIPQYSLGVKTVKNVFLGPEDTSYSALAGSSTYIQLDDVLSIPVTYTTANDYVAFVEVTRSVVNQYGGNTYYDRVNNEYIGTGVFSTTTGAYIPTFGGDTYIAYFDYLRAMWADSGYIGDNLSNGKFFQVLFFPVETMVNLDMRFDKCYSKMVKSASSNYQFDNRTGSRISRSSSESSTSNPMGHRSSDLLYGPRHNSTTDVSVNGTASNAKYLQEKAGDYSGMVGEEVNYLQEYDLYLENPVYSKEYDFFTYIPKIYEDEVLYRKDCEVMVSEEYNRNDKVDSFIKFLPNNRVTLNSVYGSINSLTVYNNNVIIFQDKGIAMQPINERAVLQDQSGSSLVLGTGDILGRIQYVSSGTGCQNKHAVIPAKTGLYYYDSINKSLYRLGNGNTDVSSIKGMSSFFSTNYDADTKDDQQFLGNGIHGIYDELNNRILLTQNATTSYTIGYNEKLDCFESLYDYKPHLYIKTFDNKILSCISTSPSYYMLHGVGNYGQYYGAYYDSVVTILSNKDSNINKIFTNIEFYTKVSATTPLEISSTYDSETINKIRFYNDYQDTTLRVLVANTDPVGTQLRIQRSLRKWRTKVPTILVGIRYNRLSSTHMFMDLYYTNNSNKKFYLDDVVTYYSPAQY